MIAVGTNIKKCLKCKLYSNCTAQTRRISGSMRTCSSLSQTYGHRIARIWTRLIIPSGMPFSRWSTIVKVSSQLTNWNERLSSHGRNYHNRSSARASVNGIVVCSDSVVWQLVFNWHVKCWFCVLVLFVGVFCSVIWCNKRNYCHSSLITVIDIH